MPQFPATRLGVVTLGVTTAVVLAACGGGGSTAKSSSSGGASAAAPASAGGASPAGAASGPGVADYVAYTGGKPGKADPTKSPIAIGWVNAQGGPVAPTPEATDGAQAAVKYVNDNLGGIDGHPLVLKTCFIAAAEEEGQKCGQQLLNDPSVVALAFGTVVVGDTSFNSVVAGAKPLMLSVSIGPSNPTAKNAFIMFGDLTHVFGPWGTYSRDVLKAKTAAVLYTNDAANKLPAAAVRKGLEDAGLTVKSVGFDDKATDLIGPVTAAGAQTADVIVPISQGQGCVGVAKALKQLGVNKPVVSTPVCLSAQTAKGFGGDLPTWTYGVAQTLPDDPDAADSKAYREAAKSAGLPDAEIGQVWAAISWSQVLMYTKMFNAIGADKITPQTVTDQLKAFTGPVVMGAPAVKCGQFPEAPAVCNNQSRFYQYQGKGSWKPLTDYLKPPA